MSFPEIIELLKGGCPGYRPDMSAITCETFVQDCIQDCWHEDPEHRPDFKYIRVRLKHMLQGM